MNYFLFSALYHRKTPQIPYTSQPHQNTTAKSTKRQMGKMPIWLLARRQLPAPQQHRGRWDPSFQSFRWKTPNTSRTAVLPQEGQQSACSPRDWTPLLQRLHMEFGSSEQRCEELISPWPSNARWDISRLNYMSLSGIAHPSSYLSIHFTKRQGNKPHLG